MAFIAFTYLVFLSTSLRCFADSAPKCYDNQDDKSSEAALLQGSFTRSHLPPSRALIDLQGPIGSISRQGSGFPLHNFDVLKIGNTLGVQSRAQVRRSLVAMPRFNAKNVGPQLASSTFLQHGHPVSGSMTSLRHSMSSNISEVQELH